MSTHEKESLRVVALALPFLLLLACSSTDSQSRDLAVDSSALDTSVVDTGFDMANSDLSSADMGPPPPPTFSMLEVEGETIVSGVFDPALEYDSNGVGWMTYSWVDWPRYVETHLAKSTDQGQSWQFVTKLSTSSTEVFDTNEVVWRYETSTLVYDGGAPAAERWKYLAQRVPAPTASCSAAGCDALFQFSTIVLRTAPSPEGPWSAESCLFGKAEWGCAVDINSLDLSLADNVAYNELGSLVVGDTLYLSLDSTTTNDGVGEWPLREVILLASSDHGVSWRYVGTITDYDDAMALGYLTFTATSLVEEAGRHYLLVSPAGATSAAETNKAHNGTLVIEFEDLSQAKLRRDAQGTLIVSRYVERTKDSGGMSDYDEGNRIGGMLFGQLDHTLAPDGVFFQIYSTGVTLEP